MRDDTDSFWGMIQQGITFLEQQEYDRACVVVSYVGEYPDRVYVLASTDFSGRERPGMGFSCSMI